MFNKTLLALTLVAVATLIACGPAPQPPADTAAAAAAEAEATTAKAEAERAPPAAPKPAPQPRPAPAPVARKVCDDCGTIASITEERQKGDASAIGTLGGAAAGGVAGSQFGKKSGKVLATIGGAVLGGLAGREVEKQVRATTVYNVVVDMEAGGQRTVTLASASGFGVGSKVRVSGDSLIPN